MAILYALVGVGLLGYSLRLIYVSASSAKWPTVPGRVVGHRPIEVAAGSGGGRYQVELLIDYDYDGQHHRAPLPPLAAAAVYRIEADAMEAAQATSPLGSEIIVSVNPDDELELEVPGRDIVRALFIAVVGVIFCVAGLSSLSR